MASRLRLSDDRQSLRDHPDTPSERRGTGLEPARGPRQSLTGTRPHEATKGRKRTICRESAAVIQRRFATSELFFVLGCLLPIATLARVDASIKKSAPHRVTCQSKCCTEVL